MFDFQSSKDEPKTPLAPPRTPLALPRTPLAPPRTPLTPPNSLIKSVQETGTPLQLSTVQRPASLSLNNPGKCPLKTSPFNTMPKCVSY